MTSILFVTAKIYRNQFKCNNIKNKKKFCIFCSISEIEINFEYSKTLVNSAWQTFIIVLSPLWGKILWKISLFVIWQILGMFVNTLTADDKYALRNSENFLQPIQKQ